MNKEINRRWFQWIAGEHRGQVKVFDYIENDGLDVYIVFKDGSRINENYVAPINQTDLTNKFMAEVDSPNNLWTFNEVWEGRTEERWEELDDTNPGNKVCVDPGTPGRKVIKLIPPTPTPKNHSIFGAISNAHKIQEVTKIEPIIEVQETPKTVLPIDKINEHDPVYILMSKSKKENLEITMSMDIMLPPKALYDISKKSFDEGEKKFIEYIVTNIDTDYIRDALKIAISNMYEKDDQTLQ